VTSTDLVVQDDLTPSVTLFGTDDPGAALERQRALAVTLADVVRQQGLVVRIGQSDHLRVEAWSFLGSLLGVFPVVEWSKPVMDGEQQIGWEARVEARTRGGEIVGSAEAMCLRTEKTWKGREDYALRSMAQTRATSKALRLPLGFIVVLAGYNPTPAEEMSPHQPASDPAEDVPFGDVAPPLGPEIAAAKEQPPATGPQKKKLNVLVGKLREQAGRITTENLWKAVALLRGVETDALMLELGAFDDDGVPHWSPLREALTKAEANSLIDRLEKLDAEPQRDGDAEQTAFPIPDAVRQQLETEGQPA
jgi:hypothetical protein